MKNPSILLFITALITLSGCDTKNTDIGIYDLQCENLTEPQGLGTSVPALSWKINSSVNGTKQKAYQVLVASDLTLLNDNDADLWNSGKVKSDQQLFVSYSGKPLISRSLCVWKVRVWDGKNKVSEWSPESSFSIGLLDKSDWTASYIGLKSESEYTISPQFRKSFVIGEEATKIFLHVNSLGYHEIYLNGQKTGNKVLTPAVSQFSKRSQVLTYDITDLVSKGNNDIVIWTGKGWYSKGLPGVEYNGPLVRAQIDILRNNSWSTLVKTDTTWKGRNSGYYDTGTWFPWEFGGELVDAALLLPELKEQNLNNTVWKNIEAIDVTDHMATSQMTEANIITDTIKPVSVKPLGNNNWFIDMGTTLTGLTEIKFKGLKPGQKVLIEYCDHLDKDGMFVDQRQSDRYIASGEAGEFFINKFNYHAYRYIKISNIKNEPAREDISSFPVRTGFKLASSFECSDPDMNQIHDMIFYTLQCLSPGGYLVDCPQIERLGYGGDGNASTETAQTMFDLAPLYRNWLQAWGDCIREDGGMPHTAPNPYRAGGGPYWCGFIITASWRTYMNYGDKRILEKYYSTMQKWLGYADKYSPSGLLEPWPETDYRSWYLGDWASPEGTDHTNPASIKLVNNCFMAVCFETMEKIAAVLNKNNDAENYAARKLKITEQINNELFDKAKNIYGSGIQIDLTYPLLAGIVPDNLKETISNKLKDVILKENDGHIACGLVGIPVFTEWCEKNNEADLFYSMLKKRDYPGYLYMIDNGATTTWEHWNGARSRIHNCYNGVGSWFYQSVGGIKRDDQSAGYKNIIIDPDIPKGISWAKTTKETPYGSVSVNWKIEGNFMNLEIIIPVGCSANYLIPDKILNFELNGKIFENNLLPVILLSGKNNLSFNMIEE